MASPDDGLGHLSNLSAARESLLGDSGTFARALHIDIIHTSRSMASLSELDVGLSRLGALMIALIVFMTCVIALNSLFHFVVHLIFLEPFDLMVETVLFVLQDVHLGFGLDVESATRLQ